MTVVSQNNLSILNNYNMRGVCMDITYFESPGEQNTERVLDIVKKRCEDLGINVRARTFCARGLGRKGYG